MFKRILSAVGLVFLGFIAVVTLVLFQIRSIVSIVHQQGRQNIPLYKEAVAASDETGCLEKKVAAAFLSSSSSDLKLAQTEAKETLGRLSQTIKRLSDSRFQSIQGAQVDAPAESQEAGPLSVGSKSGLTNAASITMAALVKDLSENLETLSEATDKALSLAENQLSLRAELQGAKEALSAVYRKSFPLAKADEKAFGVLSRAVVNVLYSTSTRDLNFVGRTKFKEGLAALEKAELGAESKAALEGLKQQFEATLSLALQAGASGADYAYFAGKAEEIQVKIGVFRRFAEKEFQDGQGNLNAKTASTVSMSIWISIGTILAGAFFAVWMARSITCQIGLLAHNLDQSAVEVAVAAGQINSASQSLAESASEHASSLEETSASLEEMTGMIKRNAEAAALAKVISAETRTFADVGGADMDMMRQSMLAIKASSDQVAQIVRSIDEIAFQTNILALNAAVEAARAGDAGAGFAVVADEVRNLARRSGSAAKETAAKIEDAIRKTNQGVEVSAKVADNFKQITAKARQVDDLIAEISAASKEQSQGIGSINSAVSQMDKVTQKNASAAAQTATAAEELNSQASAQKASVADLIGLVGSVKSASADHATSLVPRRQKQIADGKIPAARKSESPDIPMTSGRGGESASQTRRRSAEGQFADF